jgi:hypothetical protein
MSSHLIRSDLIPIVIGFVLIMAVLAAGLLSLRRLPPGTDPRALSRVAAKPGPGWLRLLRLMLGTAFGGYLLLMAIVVIYYYGVARVAGRFLESAFTGCAVLLAVSLPLFALASWLLELWRRRGERAGDGKASEAAPPG